MSSFIAWKSQITYAYITMESNINYLFILYVIYFSKPLF